MFWNTRDPTSPHSENKSPFDTPTSPSKRSSIENLKRASRVKNSSIFEIEQKNNYNPSQPKILDGKPLAALVHGNAFNRSSINSLVTVPKGFTKSATSTPTQDQYPSTLATFADGVDTHHFNPITPLSPSKNSISPMKSSLSKKTAAQLRRSGFDPTTGIWEDHDDEEKILPAGKGLHRHAKSVTFNHEPPQINEYEMVTPDPSSIASGSREGSYESVDDDDSEDAAYYHSSSIDVDDSFDASLEDTDKTPVVLPEDWRFLSPELANTNLAQQEDDVFETSDLGSPAPSARPGSSLTRPVQTSTASVDSNGQVRPLPPLPARDDTHSDNLSSTPGRASSAHRALPSPPPASTVLNKDDVRHMSNGALSLEDRMLLLQVEDNRDSGQVETQRDRRMRRAGSREMSPLRQQCVAVEDTTDKLFDLQSVTATQTSSIHGMRISRDSIMQALREEEDVSRSDSQKSIYSQASYDPDTPIPSREDPTQVFEDDDESEIVIKEEPVDDDELYAIPDLYSRKSSGDTSHYSVNSSMQHSIFDGDHGHVMPKAGPQVLESKKSVSGGSVTLPEFEGFGRQTSFNFELQGHTTGARSLPHDVPKVDVNEIEPPTETLPNLAALREEITRPFTPELTPPQPAFVSDEESEPATPSSVIRHPIDQSVSPFSEHEDASAEEREPVSPLPGSSQSGEVRTAVDPRDTQLEEHRHDAVPDPQAIQTSFSKSDRTEPTKRNDKRISSLVQLEIPRAESGDDLGSSLATEFDRVVESQKVQFEQSLRELYHPYHGCFPPMQLLKAGDDRTVPSDTVTALGARANPCLSKCHIANRSSERQRGYLMRQNTKVVVASERMSCEDSQMAVPVPTSLPLPDANEVIASPRNVSQPAWTAEPWNNKTRRKSLRVAGEDVASKRMEPVPHLPVQSNNGGLDSVVEDEIAEEEVEDVDDGAERGRLFIKVVGVKDLQLPFPTRKPSARSLGTLANEVEDEKTQFALTLDNGLHCVTTAWLDLAKSAPIGQEFELVVLNELEFQLTLQMKLEKPPPPRVESPTKPPPSPKKQSALGRLFGSPKKKKASDIQPTEPEPRRPVTPPSAYELVQGLVAEDGSFARAYVSLSEFENQAYGRPCTVDVGCFNEWAMESVPIGSSRSKKGVIQLQRRPPYEIGKLELQLLYVPKPKGVRDEDMPKSMNSAIRAMREAEDKAKQQAEIKPFEGFLSQQGGDCPYWRRRFFRLVGSKLTAYHEATRQPRATINLAKASRLIDDKANLTQKETSSRGGKRRKSAFADDEEGYMFVEEGFRLRFGNGEVIDFYADNALGKQEWMAALSQVVGKNLPSTSAQAKSWTDVVLQREKSMKLKARDTTRTTSKNLPVPVPRSSTTLASAASSVPPLQLKQPRAAQLDKPQHFASGAVQSPHVHQTLSPRPHGHSRGESLQTGIPKSLANSPVKPRINAAERHRKTMSMWG